MSEIALFVTFFISHYENFTWLPLIDGILRSTPNFLRIRVSEKDHRSLTK